MIKKGIVIFVIFCVIGSFASSIPIDLKVPIKQIVYRNNQFRSSSGLVGYWRFDEGNGNITYDSSGNNNHGMIYSANWTGGLNGSTLDFDGMDDYVKVDNDTSLNFGAYDFTLEAWFNTGNSKVQNIIYKRDYSLGYEGQGYALLLNGGKPGFIIRDGNEYNLWGATTGLDDNNWHHIVGLKNGSTSYLYIDGVQDTNTLDVSGAGSTDNVHDFYIGVWEAPPDNFNFFDGLIDEIHIYNKSLSIDEIIEHYEEYYPVETVYIDDDFNESTHGWLYNHFDKIQKGIDIVRVNGTVYVYNGTYNEWVEITKAIELHGEDKESTIIDGTGFLHCLRATSSANNIVITNLTTQNAQSIGVNIWANNSVIDNVTSCWNTNDYGFYTREASNIVIKNCQGYNNERGLFDRETDGLEVFGCTFWNNTDWGMNTYFATTNAYIHHNNFYSNAVNVDDVSDGSNLWDYNYYDDYSGVDADEDRIGDIPYDINGSAGEQDLHPLMFPWGEIPPVANFTYSSNVSPIIFNGSISYDRDGIIVNWTWDFGDGTIGYGTSVNHSYSATGVYNVMLTITDDDGYKDNITLITEIEVINQSPGVPIINGPSSGMTGHIYSYTFVSVDPNDDNVFYQIKWGDGTVEGWIGPYDSNEIIIREYAWAEQGNYTIMARARDEFDVIGDWGMFLVNMPRNHAINTPFLNFLQSHPNMFPILKMLLQRFGLQ